jgi:methylmalonyl-CoA/ethylmalonyl-CoA epimerase
LRFHHVGIVVSDVERYFEEHFKEELGVITLEGPVVDANQGATTAMVRTGPGAGIELVAPIGSDSPVSAALESGGGFHHICYEVNDINEAFDSLRSKGLVPVSEPVPAVLFGGSKVAFMFSKHGGLIELVEARKEDESR